MKELVLAVLLVFGGHEVNHDLMADRLDVPISWNEDMKWTVYTQDPRELALIGGAGFRGQAIVAESVRGTSIEKPVRWISAFNELGYAIKPNGISGGEGDVQLIQRSIGKKAGQVARVSLTVSAMSNLFGDNQFRFGQSNNGTPMLVFRRQF